MVRGCVSAYLLPAVATNNPSWLWYATRGAGVATLVFLTASVVLGIGAALRWEGESTPRFVTASLHRNLSLLAVVLLAAHIATTVLDPFAHISAADAIIPFAAAYRPKWLGLGVLAAEILAAVAATSMLRAHIGPRLWRFIHWTAYACWPLAVVHGLGTGSDAQAPWMIGLTASCIAAVLMTVVRRLWTGRLATLPVRFAAGTAVGVSLAATAAWALQGPLQPGWATKAGTPTTLLSQAAATPAPVHRGAGSYSDDLVGTMVRDSAGRTQVALRDIVDTALTLTIRPPGPAETLPVLTVARDGRVVCTAPARATASLYAVCGTTRLTIMLYGGPGSVTGRLAASGPLG
jgi:sulfoxide reductase heme-binding subunit YedZ